MQQPPGQAQAQGPPQIEPEIVKHVQNFTYWLPVNGPQPGTPEGEAKIKEMRNSYLVALNKQHKAKGRIAMLDNMVQQRQKSGQEIPPEVANNKAQMQKEYNAAKEFVDTFREKQKQNKMEHDQRRAQQQQQQQSQPNQEQSAQQFASQPNIKAEPAIKVEAPVPQAPPPQQFGNMQGGPQQTQQQQPQQQQQQGAHPQAPPSMPQQQPMRQPPVPLQQHNQAPNQHPQFAQPGQPQPHQQPPRPQINPHQANGMQHAQTNSPHPQSATSNAGRPVPLSHQDAVNAAQRSYSDNAGMRTATPMQGQGNFHTPGSREREQMNNPKMPIPRNLNTSQPSPVPMGPARPTISGPTNGAPGPMGQPVIARMPPFQLEGDNDRVLSKRKLDELVRQVTGGSEEALTPEVEEVRLENIS
jgi:transcription initiation factor TFIID subunit 12